MDVRTCLNIRAYTFLISKFNLRLNPSSRTVRPSSALALYDALSVLASQERSLQVAVSGTSDKRGQLRDVIFILSQTGIDECITTHKTLSVHLNGNGSCPYDDVTPNGLDSADDRSTNPFSSTHTTVDCDNLLRTVVALDQHAAPSLNELRLLSARKALPSIRERLLLDRSIVEGGFIRTLNAKRISTPVTKPIDYPDEFPPDMNPSYYTIPLTLHELFELHNVPRLSPNKPYFELTSASLPAWRDTIVHLLNDLTKCLDVPCDSPATEDIDVRYLSESNLQLVLATLDNIRTLVNTRGFQAFLDTNHVDQTLGLAMLRKEEEMMGSDEREMRKRFSMSSSSDVNSPAKPSRWNLVNLADSRKEVIESYNHVFTRWLLGLTTWVDAFEVVTNHPLLQPQNKPIRLHKLYTKPSGVQMTPVRIIVDSTLDSMSVEEGVKMNIARFVQSVVSAGAWNDGTGFSGSLHSEAACFALHLGCRDGSMQLEEQEETAGGDHRKSYYSVGLTHKSCWCCARLAVLGRESGVKFEIKGAHHVISAWDPPQFGIPHSALETIEKELKKKLADTLQFISTPPASASVQ